MVTREPLHEEPRDAPGLVQRIAPVGITVTRIAKPGGPKPVTSPRAPGGPVHLAATEPRETRPGPPTVPGSERVGDEDIEPASAGARQPRR